MSTGQLSSPFPTPAASWKLTLRMRTSGQKDAHCSQLVPRSHLPRCLTARITCTSALLPGRDLPTYIWPSIAECNNALIYPGLGLGAIVSQSRTMSDTMLLAGTQALASLAPALKDPDQALLPDFQGNVQLIYSSQSDAKTFAQTLDVRTLRWLLQLRNKRSRKAQPVSSGRNPRSERRSRPSSGSLFMEHTSTILREKLDNLTQISHAMWFMVLIPMNLLV